MVTRAGSSKSCKVFVRESNQILHSSSPDESLRRAIALARRRTKRRKVLNVVPAQDVRSNRKTRTSSNFATLYTNSLGQFCKTLASCEDRLAAVIVTPDESDLKNKGFLREVRELTSAEGALLIWRATVPSMDEGAREFYGIQPDIICFEEQKNAAP